MVHSLVGGRDRLQDEAGPLPQREEALPVRLADIFPQTANASAAISARVVRPIVEAGGPGVLRIRQVHEAGHPLVLGLPVLSLGDGRTVRILVLRHVPATRGADVDAEMRRRHVLRALRQRPRIEGWRVLPGHELAAGNAQPLVDPRPMVVQVVVQVDDTQTRFVSAMTG